MQFGTNNVIMRKIKKVGICSGRNTHLLRISYKKIIYSVLIPSPKRRICMGLECNETRS